MFPPSVIARRNSTSFTLITIDDEQRTQQHTIPAYSYLFAPIRPRHLDPQLWENPHRFDPERFNGEEGKKREKLLVAFSDGSRSCPAKFGFTKMLFKTMIAGFFSQVNTFKLDKSLEEIPVFSISTSWQEDYQDEITLNECSFAKGA